MCGSRIRSVGEGPFDLVYVPGAMSHVDLLWEDPARARYFGAIAEWCRLILSRHEAAEIDQREVLDSPTPERSGFPGSY